MTSTIFEPRVRPRGGRPLVAERLKIPRPGVPVLQRPRVTELIRRAATRRITLTCGPAGSGKTVACALWAAAARPAGRVAWLALDQDDRQPGRLWDDLWGAMASAPGIPGEITGERPRPEGEPYPLRLAAAAERLNAPVTLVIDNVQELAGCEALASLDLLIRTGPPALHLLLVGRHATGLQVARQRVDGELAEIGPADLACSPDEVERYFATLGTDLQQSQLDELVSRTEGWMTGLRLAALHATAAGPAAPPWRLSGDEPAVADYLRAEVLSAQSASRRLFLLRTCITDRIGGSLADAMTAGSDGAAVLDQLWRENVMIRHADRQDGAAESADYAYHPLLLDLLRAELRTELPDEIPALAGRAARWQAAHGMKAEAVRLAALAGDWDFAASVLISAGPAILLPGPAAELEPVLAAFPAKRCTDDAAVAATLAAAGVRTGDAGAAAVHLDSAERALGRSDLAKRLVLVPFLQALRVMNAIGRDDTGLVADSIAIARKADAGATSAAERQAIGLLWCALGVCALAGTRVRDAVDAFRLAYERLNGGAGPVGDQCMFRGRVAGWLAVAAALDGDLCAAEELAAESASHEQADQLSSLLASLAAGYVALGRDDAAAARREFDTSDAITGRAAGRRSPASGLARGTGGQLAGWLTGFGRTRLALRDGDSATARALLTRLSYDAAGPAAMGPALAVITADIALRDGDIGRARDAVSASLATHPGRTDLHLAKAHVLLAAGDCQGALDAATGLLGASDGVASQLTLHDQVTALAVAALAHRRLGQTERATSQLACALALARPHGLCRPFLAGGEPVRSALAGLIRPASPGAAFAARIVQRFTTWGDLPAAQPTSTRVPLTSSELAVLRFLPSHMTNQEIAEALYLSINTIKTHLRSVYRKLGVTTRRQAIVRAGHFGLL